MRDVVLTPQIATVTEFVKLVRSGLEPDDLAHVWVDGPELLGEESFEGCWAAGLFVLTAGQAQHLQRQLAQNRKGAAATAAGPTGITAPRSAAHPLAPSRVPEAGRCRARRGDLQACSPCAPDASRSGA